MQVPVDRWLSWHLEKDRWKAWDVWAHKYNLIGLIGYVQYTGNREPLRVCRGMADLLCDTFGDTPGKREIIRAGAHRGMAPTSVLEPMVLLYRMTGETRYLEFCKYILRSWEQDNGPHIISRLLELKRVDKVGDAKAYEMLSCLNGALEYYRTAGDRRILDACLNAWQDIVDNRLYITGAASSHEVFHDDFDLPNNNEQVGETCFTVTWLQFNAQLLRLTGEARFAEQLEHVVLNQLLGAQRPDCAAWGYYVQMEGKKPYSTNLDGNCCLSSGPRGLSLIPTFASSTDAEGLVVNLYEAGKAMLQMHDGTAVTLITQTQYPADERVRITVNPSAKKEFRIKFRIPAWCRAASVTVAGQKLEPQAGPDGYALLKRTWVPGDQLELRFPMEARVMVGNHLNQGKAAVCYGPLVLAADDALLEETGQTVNSIRLAGADPVTLRVAPKSAPEAFKTWPGARVFRVNAIARKPTANLKAGTTITVRLVPFAEAGATGARYKVWLALPQFQDANLLLDGRESRSRSGNLEGSICDDDLHSPVVTFDGQPAQEDWFAVTLTEPAQISRIVFVHDRNYHDGGWFDASSGKPRVQVQRTKGGAWETVGELAAYPATTATNNAKIRNGQPFTLKLAQPVTAIAARVTGRPACGDNPKQAFSSCAELQAFEE